MLLAVSLNRAFTTETQNNHEEFHCTCSLLLSCCVAWCNCCWFFFLTSCSATLISSKVTPWVDLRVSLTRFAWAFLCVSDSSSRTGGTNDLKHITVSFGLIYKFCHLLFIATATVYSVLPHCVNCLALWITEYEIFIHFWDECRTENVWYFTYWLCW